MRRGGVFHIRKNEIFTEQFSKSGRKVCVHLFNHDQMLKV